MTDETLTPVRLMDLARKKCISRSTLYRWRQKGYIQIKSGTGMAFVYLEEVNAAINATKADLAAIAEERA